MTDLSVEENAAMEAVAARHPYGTPMYDVVWRAAREYSKQREEELKEALADALLWLERIPPPEEEVRALGRGLWDETLENARAALAENGDSDGS